MGLESHTIYELDHLEPIPKIYAFVIISTTFLFFCFCNWAVSCRLHPERVHPKDQWKLKNLFISWIHAMIIGSWDILCFLLYPEMVTDLVGYHNYFIYCMVAFSTGYFFYDFFDIVVSKKSRSSWEVLLHHIAVASTFFHNLMTSRCLAYTVVALMAEINSFFLHSRKLMQMLKYEFDAPIYRCNVYVNLSTFVVCRFFALVWIVYGMVFQYERVGIQYMWILSAAIFIMWVINLILFQRLLINDVFRMKKAAKHVTNGHVTNGFDHHHIANNNGPVSAKLKSGHVQQSEPELYSELSSSNHKLYNGFKTS